MGMPESQERTTAGQTEQHVREQEDTATSAQVGREVRTNDPMCDEQDDEPQDTTNVGARNCTQSNMWTEAQLHTMVHHMTKGTDDMKQRREQEPQHTMEQEGLEVDEWIKSPLPPMQLLNHTASYTAFKPLVPIRKEFIHTHMAERARALAAHLGYTEQPRPARSEGPKPPGRHSARYGWKLPINSSHAEGMTMGFSENNQQYGFD